MKYQRPYMWRLTPDNSIGISELVSMLKKYQRLKPHENEQGDHIIHFTCTPIAISEDMKNVEIVMDDKYIYWEEDKDIPEVMLDHGERLQIVRRTYCKGLLSNFQTSDRVARWIGWTCIVIIMDEQQIIREDGTLDFTIQDSVYLGIYDKIYRNVVEDFKVYKFGVSEVPKFVSSRQPLEDITFSKEFN